MYFQSNQLKNRLYNLQTSGEYKTSLKEKLKNSQKGEAKRGETAKEGVYTKNAQNKHKYISNHNKSKQTKPLLKRKV